MLLAVLATALGVTICSKWFADRAARDATTEHLSSTGRLCVNASYPLTASVLTQIQELSGLRLAIIRDDESDTSNLRHRQYEVSSSAFPTKAAPSLFELLCDTVDQNTNTPRVISIETNGTRWNALACRLPANSNNSGDRFIVLLELISFANHSAIQAFVLPLVTGICSSIAIALVAAWVASRIGKRIVMLENHVQKIAQGSFDAIVPTGPSDTIRSLYESVNSMSQQLHKSNMQIAQNERSRLVNLMASGLAHELRNHLTGAKLAIQTCEWNATNREAMDIALQQMQFAEESIQRLLALRVDTVNVMSAPMSAMQIAQSVQNLTMPIAQHRRVDFSYYQVDSALGNSEIMIQDGSAIVGSLINLLLNAIEASGTGGKVELSFQLELVKLVVFAKWTVKDNGPGPAAEIADVMFEPFATTKREGVGIGLAMCKRIAQRQHGDVEWVRNEGWTEFRFFVKVQET